VHRCTSHEELKSCFADVIQGVVGNGSIHIQADELAVLQTEDYFQENGFGLDWIQKAVVAPKLPNYAITKIILPFSSTYLSETAFSGYQNKVNNRLEVHSDFRLDIPSLVKGMLAQGGH